MRCNGRQRENHPPAWRFHCLGTGRRHELRAAAPRCPGATVRLADSPLTARSNAKGRFILDGASSGARTARRCGFRLYSLRADSATRAAASPIGLATLPCQATVRWTELLWLMGAASPLHGLTFISTAQRSTSAPTTRDTTVFITELRRGEFDLAIDAPGFEPLQRREAVVSGKNIVKVAAIKRVPALCRMTIRRLARSQQMRIAGVRRPWIRGAGRDACSGTGTWNGRRSSWLNPENPTGPRWR